MSKTLAMPFTYYVLNISNAFLILATIFKHHQRVLDICSALTLLI